MNWRDVLAKVRSADSRNPSAITGQSKLGMTIGIAHAGKSLSNGASQIALLTLRIQRKKQLDNRSDLSYNILHWLLNRLQ